MTQAVIAAWARSPVVPVNGALGHLPAHDIASPVVRALLTRAQLAATHVDALVAGNALGAGGNPARLVALAAGLPDRCAALSIDTQCCAGLDAVATAVGLIATRQASVVIAGGVEAWTRSPIRMHRPLRSDEAPVAYDRPAFSPDPTRDPDLLEAAASYAREQGFTRGEQEAYALASHQCARLCRDDMAQEIVAIGNATHDPYPRRLTPDRARRIPAVHDSLTALTVSPKADGAAFVLLASEEAAQRLKLAVQAQWLASASIGDDPAQPLVAAAVAAQTALRRASIESAQTLHSVELHDAFAVQGLSFCRALKLDPNRINRRGGGLARGHPIGASGAIALVRALADLAREGSAGDTALAAIAGAGGVGAAAVVKRR